MTKTCLETNATWTTHYTERIVVLLECYPGALSLDSSWNPSIAFFFLSAHSHNRGATAYTAQLPLIKFNALVISFWLSFPFEIKYITLDAKRDQVNTIFNARIMPCLCFCSLLFSRRISISALAIVSPTPSPATQKLGGGQHYMDTHTS